MRRLVSPRAVVVGSALVLAVNAAMLVLSAWNRSGEPEAKLVLTDRELRVPAVRDRENSSLTLTLETSVEAPPAVRRAATWRERERLVLDLPWLDRAKLSELGFGEGDEPPQPGKDDDPSWLMERRAFVVLELEGEAWRRWIEGREADLATLRERASNGTAGPKEIEGAEALLALDRTSRSRLFPVDAGTDPRALRRRYSDRGRYAVLPAVVVPRWSRRADGTLVLLGRIRLVPECRVTVPASLRSILDPFVPDELPDDLVALEQPLAEKNWPAPVPPRYRAVLAFGRRRTPWLVEASAIPSPPAPPASR